MAQVLKEADERVGEAICALDDAREESRWRTEALYYGLCLAIIGVSALSVAWRKIRAAIE